jgi:hypothetical protein
LPKMIESTHNTSLPRDSSRQSHNASVQIAGRSVATLLTLLGRRLRKNQAHNETGQSEPSHATRRAGKQTILTAWIGCSGEPCAHTAERKQAESGRAAHNRDRKARMDLARLGRHHRRDHAAHSKQAHSTQRTKQATALRRQAAQRRQRQRPERQRTQSTQTHRSTMGW